MSKGRTTEKLNTAVSTHTHTQTYTHKSYSFLSSIIMNLSITFLSYFLIHISMYYYIILQRNVRLSTNLYICFRTGGVPLYTTFIMSGAHLDNSFTQLDRVDKGTTIRNGPLLCLNSMTYASKAIA